MKSTVAQLEFSLEVSESREDAVLALSADELELIAGGECVVNSI